MAPLEALIERSADHAGGGRFRVAKLAGLVHLLTGKAEVRNGCPIIVPIRNNGLAVTACGLDFAPRLGGIVLVCQPALSLRLNLQGVGLRPVGGRLGRC